MIEEKKAAIASGGAAVGKDLLTLLSALSGPTV